jgi:hypothetical protein
VQAVQLKPEEVAALETIQGLFEKRDYEAAQRVAKPFEQTPGFKPLAGIAQLHQGTTTVQPISALGLTIDLGVLNKLKPIVTEMRDPKVPAKVVTSLLWDPDANTKVTGIALLLMRGDSVAPDAIRPLAYHQDWLVRAAASFALSAMRDPSAADAMRQLTGQSAPDPFAMKVAQFVMENLDMETRAHSSRADAEASLQRSNELFREIVNEYEQKKEQYQQQIQLIMRQFGTNTRN